MALKICLDTVKNTLEYEEYGAYEKIFILMPLMHNENEASTLKCVAEIEKIMKNYPGCGFELNVKFAKDHHETISQFGRYPHRNAVLGRESTPEEIEYLKDA